MRFRLENALAHAAFEQMVRLAARDPIVRATFRSLLQGSGLPERARKLILDHFLSAAVTSDREGPPAGRTH
jgi:hypothetical protein